MISTNQSTVSLLIRTNERSALCPVDDVGQDQEAGQSPASEDQQPGQSPLVPAEGGEEQSGNISTLKIFLISISIFTL